MIKPPVIYNFVINCTDNELPEYVNLKDKAREHLIYTNGDLNWCLQTYHFLKSKNELPVTCSNYLQKGAINIIHSDYLLKLQGDPSYFIVCVSADYSPRLWAQFHVVQNKNQLGKNRAYVSHWLQPNLIPRNPARKEVTRVAFAGQVANGNLAGSVDSWQKALQPAGLEFVTLQNGQWNDLSTIDVLVGVRSFDKRPYNKKPPTKLYTAWHAHIPFIGGNDSAFKQIGIPGEDYVLANTQQEAIAAILLFKKDQNYYQKFVQNGLVKAGLYTSETITREWENVLQGPIKKRYYKWLSRRLFEKIRYILYLKMGNLEHVSKQVVKKIIK